MSVPRKFSTLAIFLKDRRSPLFCYSTLEETLLLLLLLLCFFFWKSRRQTSRHATFNALYLLLWGLPLDHLSIGCKMIHAGTDTFQVHTAKELSKIDQSAFVICQFFRLLSFKILFGYITFWGYICYQSVANFSLTPISESKCS